MSAANKVAVVCGVGGGTGAAVARKFAREGFSIALLSRSKESLTPVEDEIKQAGGKAISVPCDVGKPAEVESAFKQLTTELGQAQVLIYNTGPGGFSWPPPSIMEMDPQRWQAGLDAGVSGALWCCQQVLPGMVKAGHGTIIFTGATASLRGGAKFAALSVPKFALRSLSQCVAREFQPQGIHVAHVVVDGGIRAPRSEQYTKGKSDEEVIRPDAIAQTYYDLHSQDRSCWTQELDIRPMKEKW